jgi:carbon-monoxide dehydrogenase medium subunit
MKPPPFDYRRAETLEHACDLLSEHGDDAKILAGGQTLIPMLNYRLARPKMLIDISNISDRNQVSDEAHGIRVRATTVYRHVEHSASVEKRLPLLRKAIQNVAHIQIRNKGTLGGSIANADPAAEMPAMSLVFDAQLEVASKRGRRSIPACEFFTTYMTTSLQQDEILESVFFAEPPRWSGWGFEEVARRSGDYALAGSTALVSLDDAGKCVRARVVLFGVAPTPVRATEAETLLLGQPRSTALIQEAAHLVQTVVDPEADVHVTAAYRRTVSAVLTARVLEDAFRRASALQ